MNSLDWITVARPYAKAVFEAAVETGKKDLSEWSEVLAKLSLVAELPEAQFFIKRPDILPEESSAVFSSVLDEKNKDATRFVFLLAKTGRLGALPAIQSLYEQYKADYEKNIDVNVTSFEPLTKEQQTALMAALKKRLNRDVNLNTQIDKSLLGGVIIKAGDLVMDGSLRGKMHRLNDEMMS